MHANQSAGQPFDLVLVDANMPFMDGFSVAAAIKQDSTMIEAHLNRGISKHMLDDEYGAIEDYTNALAIDSNHVYALRLRAISYDELGQFEQAIVDLNRLIELNPNIADAYFLLGQAQRDLGVNLDGELNIKKAAEMGYQEAIDMLRHSNN